MFTFSVPFSRFLSLTHESGSCIALSVHRQCCVMVMLMASGARLGSWSSPVEHWQCEAAAAAVAAAAAKSLQSCPTLCDPIDSSHQAPPSLGSSRQEHWSGLPFPSPVHESEK